MLRVHLYFWDVERDCPRADGDETAGDWATFHNSVQNVLVNEKSNAMFVSILFSTDENPLFFLCCCFAKVLPSPFTESSDVPSVPVHFVCQFLDFPAAGSVLVFQVPMVKLSLPRFFDDAPAACLTPSSWCTAEGAVLVDPAATDSEWRGSSSSSSSIP